MRGKYLAHPKYKTLFCFEPLFKLRSSQPSRHDGPCSKAVGLGVNQENCLNLYHSGLNNMPCCFDIQTGYKSKCGSWLCQFTATIYSAPNLS